MLGGSPDAPLLYLRRYRAYEERVGKNLLQRVQRTLPVPEVLAHAAPSAWAGQIVDPYGGQADLKNKLLRHVTEAFREDPVRILRLARFAARFPDFTVAPETMTLMREMVAEGEVDALVSERVWQELSRGLMCTHPSRMLQVLRECGALQRLLPEVDKLYGVPQRAEYHPEIDTGIHLEMVIDASAHMNAPLDVRFACLCHDLGKGTTPADVLPRHIGHEQRSAKLLLNLIPIQEPSVLCNVLHERG